MIVRLTKAEVELARAVSLARNQQNRSLKEADGLIDKKLGSLGVDFVGAVGELAFAKWTRRPWTGAITSLEGQTYMEWRRWRWDNGDVDDIEIKSTYHEDGCLLIGKQHAELRIYVLMIAKLPTVRIAGWIDGRYAKRPMYWDDKKLKRPAYRVPQHALWPADELDVLKKER